MLKWFLNSKGEKIPVEDCLNGALSDEYPLSYLHVCAQERTWKGIPSTTQLINGTRMEYLKLLTPYAASPDDFAFRIVGTRGHQALERATPAESITELKLSDDEKSGIPDLIEKQPNGEHWLVDYKVWGSYKVVKALGLEKTKVPGYYDDGSPMLYQRSGKGYNAGDQKMVSVFTPNPDKVDIPDVELQLNCYKYFVEDSLGIKIDAMYLFIVVRDGNTVTARQRGIKFNTTYVKVRELEFDRIKDYFGDKRAALLKTLHGYELEITENVERLGIGFSAIQEVNDPEALKHSCPPMCNNQESWDGRRCDGYCPVSEICSKIGV